MVAKQYEVTRCMAKRLTTSEQAVACRHGQCNGAMECEWQVPTGTIVDRIVPFATERRRAGGVAAVVRMDKHWMPWAVAAQQARGR